MRTQHPARTDGAIYKARRSVPLISILAITAAAAAVGGSSAVGSSAGAATISSTAMAGVSEDSSTSEDERAEAFTECMRANGLPDFPDVTISSNGQVNLDRSEEGIDPFSAAYHAALETCESELPEGTHLPDEPTAPPEPPDSPGPPESPDCPGPPDLPEPPDSPTIP